MKRIWQKDQVLLGTLTYTHSTSHIQRDGMAETKLMLREYNQGRLIFFLYLALIK